MKKPIKYANLNEFKKRILANKAETTFLLLIIGVAVFVRFYRINKLHFFTYDQARDDLIVKRILVDRKWTLLGPQSSMRGVYLPPFYYYTLVPILWLSRLNPIGVDVYTATIGVLTVILIWFMAREFFGRVPGLMVGAAYATSPLVVELSRRAWNPNTQPFFVLLTIFSIYRLFQTKKEAYLILSSLAFGYAVNLHYGAMCLAPLWLFAFFWSLVKSKKKLLVFSSALVLFVFGLPLLLFDLRHNFMLTKNINLHFFAGERISLSPKNFFEPMMTSIFQIFVALLSGSFLKTAQVPFEFWGKFRSVLNFAPVSIIAHKPLLVRYQWWGIGLLIAIAASLVYTYWARNKASRTSQANFLILNLLIAVVLVSALISRLYTGKFYFFYYIFIFPVPFLFLGFLFWFLWEQKWPRWLIFLIFGGILGFNLKNVFVFEKPERMIDDIKFVAKTIAQDIDSSKTFNIAANYKNPDRWDHNGVDYRYFIEAHYGQRALSYQPEDYERAEILYVVAEGGLPDPLQTKIMEIEKFEPKEIVETWQLPKDVTLYKLGKKSN